MADSWDAVATALVAERGEALSRYAYLLTGSVDDAADLVQDALVHTFGRPRMSLTLPRAEAYVRRAILNAVIDRSRRAGTWRRVRHLAGTPERVDPADAATDERLDLWSACARSPRARRRAWCCATTTTSRSPTSPARSASARARSSGT